MKKALLAVLLFAVVLVSSCTSTAAETPTPTSPPTPTPAPTAEDYIDQGRDFADARQYQQAEQAYLKAVEIDSGSAEAHASLAFFYLSQDRELAEALRLAEKAVLLEPEDSRSQAVLAAVQEYHLIGDALENGEKAHELDPEDTFAARVLARL